MSADGASTSFVLNLDAQQIYEELDRCCNLYEQSLRELEAEKKKESQVRRDTIVPVCNVCDEYRLFLVDIRVVQYWILLLQIRPEPDLAGL